MRLPIRTRLTFAFAGLLAVVLTISGGLLLWGFSSWLDHEIREDLTAFAEEFSADITKGDDGILADFGATEPPELFAQIVERDGRIRETTRGIMKPAIDRRTLPGLTTPTFSSSQLVIGGKNLNVNVYALPVHGGPVVVLGSTLVERDESVGVLGTMLLAIGSGLLVIVSGLAWVLSGAALRPVERIRQDVSRISAIDLEKRLDVPKTGDEIANLASTLNAMLERLAHAFERERRFVNDASHELRTPLAILKTELQLALRRSRTNEELLAALTSAAEESERVNNLAENLLILARLEGDQAPVTRAPADVARLAHKVAARFELQAAEQRIVIDVDATSPLIVNADEARLDQVLGNLIDNALKFTPASGTIRVHAGRDAAHHLDLSVSDNGPGLPESFIEKAFDSFSRSEESRANGKSGAGLGLAIVKRIATAHGATVAIANLPGGGAQVSFRIPRAPEN